MSDETSMTGVIVRPLPDGWTVAHVFERVAQTSHARIAQSIAASIAGAMTVKDAFSEEPSEKMPSPKAIASYACDIATQLMQQFDERSWLIQVPDPIPPGGYEKVR